MMCKVKPEKTDSAASKMPKSSQSQTKKKPLKKTFYQHTKKKEPISKDQGKAKALLPPKDAQQFSTNWKTLLEVFKSNPPPVKRQLFQQNSKKEVPKKPTKDISKKDETHKKPTKDIPKEVAVVHKKPAKNLSKTVTDAKATKPKQVNSGKAWKDSSVPGKTQVNGIDPGQSGTEQPKAKKRKQSSVQIDSNAQLKKKKKKVEVEEKKPTESDMWFDDVDPDDIEATVGTEAADIMRKIQGTQKTDAQTTESALVKDRAFEGLTKAVAMDCEMVGVGPDGEDSIVARVSLVNQFGKCIYDKFVKPTEKVTDYRTAVSGIRPDDIKNGENVKTVQKEVAEILQGRTLVGHAIHNDLKILFLDHPKKRIRDTQKYKPFKKIVKSGRPSLKLLCREILGVKVQQGEHSSVQDAQATMRLYTVVKKHWEAEIKASHNNPELTKKTKEPRKPKSPKHK
ncbi:RNA exonuclease 4 isoform X3 [Oncorhynchus tshawytscha]|uniref:RNA exonuclease 4 isoform X2 n=1 Tax=Oncorhynchus tshawytscha TaxID=74940 RepID=UPI000D0A1CBE|nr:RNA exonuclease 4 isoform X2 [Oncorhynchus tshawytscha]XP_042158430.1 RNA exonuclease 4 isoform X3 [Oncorhynchus tshawytscha]